MANGELLERLQQLVLKLDQTGVEETTREALAAGLLPQDIISKGLAAGMEFVGQGYEAGELFVPELMLSARATLAALELLRPHMTGLGLGPPGKVVLGTVQGDVHDIGKNIVGIVLESTGSKCTISAGTCRRSSSWTRRRRSAPTWWDSRR